MISPFAMQFRRLLAGHLGIELEKLLEPFGVVTELPSNVDPLQHFVITLMCMTKV